MSAANSTLSLCFLVYFYFIKLELHGVLGQVCGEAVDGEVDGCGWGGQVDVGVVPDQDADLMPGAGGDGVYVRAGSYAVLDELVQANGGGAGGGELVAVELAEHAEDVEDGLVDAVGGEFPEAGEGWLVLKLEGPDDASLEVDAVLAGELVDPDHGLRDADAVKGAVAVAVLRALAGGAAFRVRLGEEDGGALPL